MAKIKEIIEDTPFISDLQKRFYLAILNERKTRILDFSFEALQKREKGIATKNKNV